MALWRNFCAFAAVVGVMEVARGDTVVRCVEQLDAMGTSKKILRPQTFREVPLTNDDYDYFAMEMVKNVSKIKQFTDIAEMLRQVQARRWAVWHVQAARYPDGDTRPSDKYVCATACMPLPHISVHVNFPASDLV